MNSTIRIQNQRNGRGCPEGVIRSNAESRRPAATEPLAEQPQQATQPTSVGPVGRLDFDSWNRRVKGLVFVETLEDVNRVLRNGVEQIVQHRGDEDAPTRLTVRFIVPSRLALPGHMSEFRRGPLSELVSEGWTGGVEAIADIGRCLPGQSLVYCGFNASSRQIDPEIVRRETEHMEVVRNLPIPSSEAAYERVHRAGFHFEVLTNATPEEIREITRLYREAFTKYVFPIDEEAVTGIIRNRTLVARTQTGEIVSSLVAEQVPLPFGNRTINFIEMSEAATNPVCRSNGLLTALYLRMVELLRADESYSPNSSILYAEARAPWIPASVVTRRGVINYIGLLRQHCTILAVRNQDLQYTGDLEDLTVWVHPTF